MPALAATRCITPAKTWAASGSPNAASVRPVTSPTGLNCLKFRYNKTMPTIDNLLNKYPIISGQVSREDIRTVLMQLEKVLAGGVPGDIVEFGCYIGTTSLFIRRLMDGHQENRAFHVYDSFEGLPAKSREDASPAGTDFEAGKLAVSKKQFIREFQKANLKLPIIHKGWFNDLTDSEGQSKK